jgi:hypothetical protein
MVHFTGPITALIVILTVWFTVSQSNIALSSRIRPTGMIHHIPKSWIDRPAFVGIEDPSRLSPFQEQKSLSGRVISCDEYSPCVQRLLEKIDRPLPSLIAFLLPCKGERLDCKWRANGLKIRERGKHWFADCYCACVPWSAETSKSPVPLSCRGCWLATANSRLINMPEYCQSRKKIGSIGREKIHTCHSPWSSKNCELQLSSQSHSRSR